MQESKEKISYSLKQNLVWLARYTWQTDRSLYLYFIAFTLVSAVKPFITILFPKFLIQELMGPADAARLLTLLIVFFLSAAFCYFAFARLSADYIAHLIALRHTVSTKLQKKCMETDFQNTEDPAFLTAMEAATDGLYRNGTGFEGMLRVIFQISGSLLAFLGYIAIVSSLNIFVLFYLLLNVIVSYTFTIHAKTFEYKKKDILAAFNRYYQYFYKIMYDFSYGKELRLLGLRKRIAHQAEEQQQNMMTTRKSIFFANFKANLADIIMTLLREGIIYYYLIRMVVSGQLGIADFTMYFATVAAFANWFTGIVTDFASLRAQNFYLSDIRNFQDRPDILTSPNKHPLPDAPYSIEFRDVSFHYPRSENEIYSHLNLFIPAGQKLAIVGRNGAGKTTFIKLLCRLYDVTEGEILLNGINIKEFDRSDYYKLFSAVFQEIKPLAFTVAENVSVNETNEIDFARLQRALEEADIAEHIDQLKNKTNTGMLKILDPEGMEFSGGENQRIAIARAFYKQGEILILDEPTAALDALAEAKIYQHFDQAVHDRTAIYISHRLASTFFCDIIAMFENGRVIEYGSHTELMTKHGKYADMFETQSRYYKEDAEVANQ